MLFSAFALAVDGFVIGRRTAQFFLLSFDGLLVFGFPPLHPPGLLTHAKERHFVPWQGTWEQIRTEILKAFGGMMATLVATCLGPLLIVL